MSNFSFNEAQLLKAGLPRSFVETLRGLAKAVGSGLSVTDLTEVESLLLTRNEGRSEQAQMAAQLQMLELQVALIRRQMPQLMEMQRQIEALQIVKTPNLSALEQRIADLEALAHGGP